MMVKFTRGFIAQNIKNTNFIYGFDAYLETIRNVVIIDPENGSEIEDIVLKFKFLYEEISSQNVKLELDRLNSDIEDWANG